MMRTRLTYVVAPAGTVATRAGTATWWEAAQLAALVMPSSGAAERVFSLLNNLFSDQQSKTLTDAIFLSLYLAYNKRAIGSV